jgi:hypothetical protein
MYARYSREIVITMNSYVVNHLSRPISYNKLVRYYRSKSLTVIINFVFVNYLSLFLSLILQI